MARSGNPRGLEYALVFSQRKRERAPVLSEKLYEMLVAALGVPEEERHKGENFPCWAALASKGL